MCEYSNRIVTSVFDSIRNERNYSKFLNTYRHRFFTYLPAKLPITGCIFQLPIIDLPCSARRVLHLSRRSYQRQTPPLAHSAPLRQVAAHLCSGRGHGGGRVYQSKYAQRQRPQPAVTMKSRLWHRR